MATYTPITVDEIEDTLTPLGFVPVVITGVKERVYEYRYNYRHFIRVYSSIEGRQSRSVGKDAVKVLALAKWAGADHIISHTKRINRVGGVDAIQDRLRSRIRDLLLLSPSVELDSRGQPMTLRKNRRDGSLFWGQPDWASLAPAYRETKPFHN